MWDKRVERFRLARKPRLSHGPNPKLSGFIEDVWNVTSDPHFLTFHNDYCTAYQNAFSGCTSPLPTHRAARGAVRHLELAGI